MKQADFPEWAQMIKIREGGTTLRQIGNVIYLYKSSSHREPGKKYPVVDEIYMGIVTKDGLIRASSFLFQPLKTEVKHIGSQFKVNYTSNEDKDMISQIAIVRKNSKWVIPRITEEQREVLLKYFTIEDGELRPV